LTEEKRYDIIQKMRVQLIKSGGDAEGEKRLKSKMEKPVNTGQPKNKFYKKILGVYREKDLRNCSTFVSGSICINSGSTKAGSDNHFVSC
jgi:hypothetical protein